MYFVLILEPSVHVQFLLKCILTIGEEVLGVMSETIGQFYS